jgi:hypothetical protein
MAIKDEMLAKANKDYIGEGVYYICAQELHRKNIDIRNNDYGSYHRWEADLNISARFLYGPDDYEPGDEGYNDPSQWAIEVGAGYVFYEGTWAILCDKKGAPLVNIDIDYEIY